MNSKVIKCVAGAGKTYWSREHVKAHKNGLYLAFTNSVVDDLSGCGVISRTIDSFFVSFILPKFFAIIPLIATGSEIEYLNTTDSQNPVEKNIGKIHIGNDGEIYSGSKAISITLKTPNEVLHKMPDFSNSKSLKTIFGKHQTKLTDSLRDELMSYLIHNYSEEMLYFIKSRFRYVIFDEAQDLGGSKEEFAKLVYNSDITSIFLGDENQKIMPGSGDWFEEINATERRYDSKRCPEENCKWIREYLKIEIYGDNNKTGGVEKVDIEKIRELDDGKKMLLYHSKRGIIVDLIDSWTGPKSTIGKIKGGTIDNDVVIVGKSLNRRSYYVAITRTTRKVYTIIKEINTR